MATQTQSMANIARYANKTIRLSAFLSESKLPLFVDKLATQGSDSPLASIMEALDKDINVTAEYLKDMSKILQTVNDNHEAPELEMEPSDMRVLFPDAYDPDTQTLNLFGMKLRKGADYDLSRRDNKFIRDALFNAIFKDFSYKEFKNGLTLLRKLEKEPSPTINSPLHDKLAYMGTKAGSQKLESLKASTLKILENYQNMRRKMDIKTQQTVDDRFYGGRAMLYGVTKASTYISKEDGILQLGSQHKKNSKAVTDIHNMVKSMPFIRAVEIDGSSDIRKFRDMLRDIENMNLDCHRAFELKDRKLGQYRFSGVYATRGGAPVFEKGVTLPDMEIIAFDQDSPSSIAHEIAHFMDPREDELRDKLIAHFYGKIDKEVLNEMTSKLDYFLSDAEIFARLGEIGFTLNQYGVNPDESPAELATRIRNGEARKSPLMIKHRDAQTLLAGLKELNNNPDMVAYMSDLISAVAKFSDNELALPSEDPITRQQEGVTLTNLEGWINLGQQLYSVGYQRDDSPDDVLKKHARGETPLVSSDPDPLILLTSPARRALLEDVRSMTAYTGDIAEMDIEDYLDAGLKANVFTQSQVDAHKEKEFDVTLTKPFDVYMGQNNPLNQQIYFNLAEWTPEELSLVANYTHDLYFTPNPESRARANSIMNSRSFKNSTWLEQKKKDLTHSRRKRPMSDETKSELALGRIDPELLGSAYAVGIKERILADGEFSKLVAKRWTRIGRGGAQKLANSVELGVLHKQYSSLRDIAIEAVKFNVPGDVLVMQHLSEQMARSIKIPLTEMFIQDVKKREASASFLNYKMIHGAKYYDMETPDKTIIPVVSGGYSFKADDGPRYGVPKKAVEEMVAVLSNFDTSSENISASPLLKTTLEGQLMLSAEVMKSQSDGISSMPELAGDYIDDYMHNARCKAIADGNIDIEGLISTTGLYNLMPLTAMQSYILTETPNLKSHINDAMDNLTLNSNEIKKMGERIKDLVEGQTARNPYALSNAFPSAEGLTTKEKIVAFITEYASSPLINPFMQSNMDQSEVRSMIGYSSSLFPKEELDSKSCGFAPVSLFAVAARQAVGEERIAETMENMASSILRSATPTIEELVNTAVKEYAESDLLRAEGLSESGIAMSDPVTRMLKNLYIQSSDTDLTESVPTSALIESAKLSAAATLIASLQTTTPLLGAARHITSRFDIPAHAKDKPIFIQAEHTPMYSLMLSSKALAARAKSLVAINEPLIASKLNDEHYGRSEAFSLNNERGQDLITSLSERLSDIAPDIGPQSLRAVAVTANGMDYVNFDSVRMEKVAGGDSMMKAVHNLELLSQYVQLPAVCSEQSIGVDFLPTPTPKKVEDITLEVTALQEKTKEAALPKIDSEIDNAKIKKPEKKPSVEVHKPNNDDVPSAGSDSLSARNQMRLW